MDLLLKNLNQLFNLFPKFYNSILNSILKLSNLISISKFYYKYNN